MCSCPEGPFEYDHIRANRLHGLNALENCMVLCRTDCPCGHKCHELKTVADKELIKMENRREKVREVKRAKTPPKNWTWPSRSLPSRKFEKRKR